MGVVPPPSREYNTQSHWLLDWKIRRSGSWSWGLQNWTTHLGRSQTRDSCSSPTHTCRLCTSSQQHCNRLVTFHCGIMVLLVCLYCSKTPWESISQAKILSPYVQAWRSDEAHDAVSNYIGRGVWSRGAHGSVGQKIWMVCVLCYCMLYAS